MKTDSISDLHFRGQILHGDNPDFEKYASI